MIARALVLVGLLLVACSPMQLAPGADPLVIGAIYPLTGPQQDGGREELGGVQAALDVARARGVAGAGRVELRVIDVQTPDQARAAVDRLIDTDHASLIIGTYGSTLSEVAAARADERRVVYWETGAVADSVMTGRSYVFRTVATGGTLGRMAVRFTQDVLLAGAGLSPAAARVAIVSVDDVYGASVADAEEAGARAAGMQVAVRVRYDPHAFSPDAVADQVAAIRPDYLFDVSYLDDGIAIWRGLLDRRVPLRGAVGTSSAFCMKDFGERLAGQAVGLYAADKPDGSVAPEALTPATRQLLDAARRAYTTRTRDPELPIPAVAGFVGGWVLFHDVLPAVHGAMTSDAIRTAAYAVDVPAGQEINGGGVKFSPPGSPDAGQNQRTVSVVGQWQAVETMRIVFPSPFAIAPPRLELSAPRFP